MSGIEMRRIGAGFIFGLELIEIFKFFESMFINCANGFRQISIHLMISDIKISIIIVNNPWKNRILRKIIM